MKRRFNCIRGAQRGVKESIFSSHLYTSATSTCRQQSSHTGLGLSLGNDTTSLKTGSAPRLACQGHDLAGQGQSTD